MSKFYMLNNITRRLNVHFRFNTPFERVKAELYTAANTLFEILLFSMAAN